MALMGTHQTVQARRAAIPRIVMRDVRSPEQKTLLLVGPHPPPVGGGTVNVQILLQELARHPDIRVISINTSPPETLRQTGTVSAEELRRGLNIARDFIANLGKSDSVLIIATATSILSVGALLVLLARANHVPCYIKPLGADLGVRLKSASKPIRNLLVKVLSKASGVLAQTRGLQQELAAAGCSNVAYIPGYRPAPAGLAPRDAAPGQLRLIFLSQIYREKGAFLLLEALRALPHEEGWDGTCDFYGPILEEDRGEFLSQLQSTPSARYMGMAEIGSASQLMARYDCLVFPTLRASEEGYPGVVIEAMQAGIPVISTSLKSISELITDNENGLLVPMGDSEALTRAIRKLMKDAPLREKMGRNNLLRAEEFRSDRVVGQMLELIFPSRSCRWESAV